MNSNRPLCKKASVRLPIIFSSPAPSPSGDYKWVDPFLTISSYYGFAGMTIICFQKKDNIKYLFRLFIIVSSIIAFLVLLQSCKIYIPFFEYGGKRLGLFMGPFYHPNHYGYYLTITLMANVGLFYLEKSKKVKIALLLSFALQSYALVLDNTFACFLSVMVGLICFIVFNWIRNKKTHIIDFSFIIILFVVALLVLLTPYQSVFSEFVKISKDVGDIATNTDADHAGSGRWHLWKVSFETILDHPIFGIGSDMSNPIMFDHICDRPHNEFIQYALFYGIPGFLLYFGLLVSIMLPDLINIKKIRKETFFCFIITIAYLFNSLFGNTIYYITPLFIIILVACIEKTNGTLSNDAVQTDEMDSNCINDDSQLVNDEIEINGKTAI